MVNGMERFLETGKIVSVQGLKGEVRVQPWCDGAEFLCGFDTLYLDKGRKTVRVEDARVLKSLAVLKLEGIDTVEQAESLRNKILYMDRNDVELDDGCFFIADLIGMEVRDADDTGIIYGTIEDVSQTGANDVYHIKAVDGKVTLIPAIPDVVVSTDINSNTMLIRPLKGLFDDED